MPLTAGEKQRRYRERLKQTNRYDEAKAKNRESMKRYREIMKERMTPNLKKKIRKDAREWQQKLRALLKATSCWSGF